jgi:glucose-1-phosphate thymidylyltransferase
MSKQLMPVYDKPMIYYPLSVLMLAGIREILIITTPEDRPAFERLFGDGSELGLSIIYATQEKPEGIGQALLIGRDFAARGSIALILGDNLFFGHGLADSLRRVADRSDGATVFAYKVKDPERYGVVDFDDSGRVVSIEEKPEKPRSSYAITGLYFYDARAADIAASLEPSARGELEITDVNRAYLESGDLKVEVLGRGIAWLDTGTFDSLLQAANFMHAIEERQGLKVACIEEIAYQLGYIDREQLERMAAKMGNEYGRYLTDIVSRDRRDG